MNAIAAAVRTHVAGPVEREPEVNTAAGWLWVQRCLRCDHVLYERAGFGEIGEVMIELENGGTLKGRAAMAAKAGACIPA